MIKKGQLLVFRPLQPDPYFERTVIFLCNSTPKEGLGLILNRPTKMTLNEVISGEKVPPGIPIYFGGPVAQNQLFYVHNKGDLIVGSEKIVDSYSWHGDFRQVLDGLNSKSISQYDIRFFVGYTGWKTKQLENEVKRKYWSILTTPNQSLLRISSEEMWTQQMERLGGNLSVFGNFPSEPCMN